jgi:hypothetical protein
MEQDLQSGRWETWSDEGQHDTDLAAHFTMLWERGLALMGPPIRSVFPRVCRSERMPHHAVCENGTITSKQEAGELALAFIPNERRQLVTAAWGRGGIRPRVTSTRDERCHSSIALGSP